MRGALLNARIDLNSYNGEAYSDLSNEQIDALLSEEMRSRARKSRRMKTACGTIMGLATAVALILHFLPAFHAQGWFWLPWPVGAVVCGSAQSFVRRHKDRSGQPWC